MNLNLAGFLFGVTNKENPATYWGAVHLGPNSVRIFIEQDLTGFDKTAILDQPISVGETVHIKLEVGTDKVFKVYVRDKVDGTGETKWIYTGGGLFYVIGTLEKGSDNLIHFKAESDRMPALNAGPDMYATQSFYNDPQGRRILISWMPDDTTTQNPEVVAEGKVWDGAQSLPMETKLETINGQVRLTSYPIEEVNALRSDLLYSCQDIVAHYTSATVHNTTRLRLIGCAAVFLSSLFVRQKDSAGFAWT